jgi:hypothetical protein
MSLCTLSNRLCATFVATTVLPIGNLVTHGGYYSILTAVNLLCLFGVYKWLPETKGKTLEDMVAFFQQLVEDDESHKNAGATAAVRDVNDDDDEVQMTVMNGSMPMTGMDSLEVEDELDDDNDL